MTSDDDLVIYPVPSLVATLLNREKANGKPLTEREVAEICKSCTSIAVPRDVAKKMDETRGYRDIDPECGWDQWQEVRVELLSSGNDES